ncbi:hypothetical protein OV142_02760 [Nannocystis sp. SCPEA4]|nr:hypothetical protein [Nannocystis sp. SCPEA4]
MKDDSPGFRARRRHTSASELHGREFLEGSAPIRQIIIVEGRTEAGEITRPNFAGGSVALELGEERQHIRGPVVRHHAVHEVAPGDVAGMAEAERARLGQKILQIGAGADRIAEARPSHAAADRLREPLAEQGLAVGNDLERSCVHELMKIALVKRRAAENDLAAPGAPARDLEVALLDEEGLRDHSYRDLLVVRRESQRSLDLRDAPVEHHECACAHLVDQIRPERHPLAVPFERRPVVRFVPALASDDESDNRGERLAGADASHRADGRRWLVLLSHGMIS